MPLFCFNWTRIDHGSNVIAPQETPAASDQPIPGTLSTALTAVRNDAEESTVLEKQRCRPFQSIMAALKKLFSCLKRLNCFATTTEETVTIPKPLTPKEQCKNVDNIIEALKAIINSPKSGADYSGIMAIDSLTQNMLITQKIYKTEELQNFGGPVLMQALMEVIRKGSIFDPNDIKAIKEHPEKFCSLFRERCNSLPSLSSHNGTMITSIMAFFATFTGENKKRVIEETLFQLLATEVFSTNSEVTAKNKTLIAENTQLRTACSNLLASCANPRVGVLMSQFSTS